MISGVRDPRVGDEVRARRQTHEPGRYHRHAAGVDSGAHMHLTRHMLLEPEVSRSGVDEESIRHDQVVQTNRRPRPVGIGRKIVIVVKARE